MEPEITPEQKAQLTFWAGQRDSLLTEISGLRAEKEKLEKENKEKAEASSEMETRMVRVSGRIEELQKKEAELPLLISKEVAGLESKKTVLETSIGTLEKLIVVLTTQKTSLESDVSLALSTFNTLKDEALTLDKIVDHVTRVSSDNIKSVDIFVNNLKASLEEIVEVNKKNVFETNVVIEKLPAMLVEAQKHGLIRNKI
jgi:chromosome segregation ATPase